ncbi:MAG: D-alanyl-D-alanine carboxypeptidase [Clostridia bacterium]|nr:D-alanyl-D-alanine carboxypeptidase [Clostridia bacterium]
MKRFFCTLLSILFVFAILPAVLIGEEAPMPDPFSDITTPYLYLMESETEACLYSRRGDEKAFPASTTKVMTALIAVENLPDLNKVITLGWRPVTGFGPTSSLMGLEAGEQIALIDILYGMLMRSGNDAAKALAIESVMEHFGRDTEPAKAVSLFVQLMNEKAQELGMTSTHFATVDGRHDSEHYTTAHDFALLMKAALNNPLVLQIMSTTTHKVEPTNKHPNGFYLENSNKLRCTKSSDTVSYIYENCIGGKTGETNEAGYCLLTAARKNDVTLILVQFGDSNTETPSYYRYQNAPVIYEWGFENYRAYSLSEFQLTTEFDFQAECCSPFDELGGRFTAHAVIDGLSITGSSMNVLPYINDPSLIRTTLIVDDGITAPIKRNDVIGYVEYYFYGDSCVRAELIADRSVASASTVTAEPHEPAIINGTPPSGSGKISNILLQRNPGDKQYSEWVYYDGSLYTMNNTEWHYLYLADEFFRTAASVDKIGSIGLYRRYFDSDGESYYIKEDHITDGREYAIVIDNMALSSDQKSNTLKGVPVVFAEGDVIIGGIDDSTIWRFESSGNGYRVSNGSKYLVRRAGSGVLFWILILVLALVAVIIIRAIAMHGKHQKRYRRNSRRYRTSWS